MKEEIKKGLLGGLFYGLLGGLFYGLLVGLVFGLLVGLVFGLLGGLLVGLVVGLLVGLLVELLVGLVFGLLGGLLGGLVTQIIAFLTSNPDFSAVDFWMQLILLIIIQVVGWMWYFKLKRNIQLNTGGHTNGRNAKGNAKGT